MAALRTTIPHRPRSNQLFRVLRRTVDVGEVVPFRAGCDDGRLTPGSVRQEAGKE
jgi:hypothetical protein